MNQEFVPVPIIPSHRTKLKLYNFEEFQGEYKESAGNTGSCVVGTDQVVDLQNLVGIVRRKPLPLLDITL